MTSNSVQAKDSNGCNIDFPTTDKDNLYNTFANEVEAFQHRIVNLKENLDTYDRHHDSRKERLSNLLLNRKRFHDLFTIGFKALWQIYENLKGYEKKLANRLLVDNLEGFFLSPEINNYIYSQPLGYPGDFKSINYLYHYSEDFLGNRSFDILINDYTTSVPIAKSTVERKRFFKHKIKNYLVKKGRLNVLSIGSGDCVELIELAENSEIDGYLQITCIDMEQKALKSLESRMANIPVTSRRGISLQLLNLDLNNLIRDKTIGRYLNFEYDLIYSAGLFDYLSDRVAVKIIEEMHKRLNSGGELVICSVNKNEPWAKLYYEILGRWKLIFRSSLELKQLEGRRKSTILEVDCHSYMTIERD